MSSIDSIAQLNHLVVYRNLLHDDLIRKLLKHAEDPENADTWYELCSGLISAGETLGLQGSLWQSYLLYLMARDENIFSTTVQKSRGQLGSGLRRAVAHDLNILQNFLQTAAPLFPGDSLISRFEPTCIQRHQDFMTLHDFGETPAKHSATEWVDIFIHYYTLHGCGSMSGFAAFRLNESARLCGIQNIDAISLDDLVGCEYQKEILLQNTAAFLAGKPANNVLLVGGRGTGKSSCVKGLINRYYYEGLRLIEVHKHQLRHLNAVIDEIRGRSQKFILFLDDLSFEEAETEYKYLKSVIDGSVEAQPDNVLICATSNRRHLIRETWSDREDAEDIHSADTVHEKISLSDRFGITLHFPMPDQAEYLQIVQALAERYQVALPQNELQRQALQWVMTHSGRSGRVALQFIRHAAGRQS